MTGCLSYILISTLLLQYEAICRGILRLLRHVRLLPRPVIPRQRAIEIAKNALLADGSRWEDEFLRVEEYYRVYEIYQINLGKGPLHGHATISASTGEVLRINEWKR